MKELGYREARQLQTRVNQVLGCKHPLAVALKAEATRVPRPDLESTILCREKLSRGLKNDYCAVIDGSPCPLNLPIDQIS